MQSILYTPTSGIWRTVWLEPVPDQHITKLDIIPDVDKKLLNVKVHGSSDAVMLDLKMRIEDGGKEVAIATGRVGKLFQVCVVSQQMTGMRSANQDAASV